jgi:DNA-binding MarR family transcriptional regulator
VSRATDERRRALFQGRGAAFLMSQVGAHSSRRWNERVQAVGLDSRAVMLLWNVAIEEGRSQRELAEALRLPGSRVVALVDMLEAGGWVQRRLSTRDRRTRALHLTRKGRALADRMMQIAAEHEAELTESLRSGERAELVDLLTRIARAQDLIPTSHPDF